LFSAAQSSDRPDSPDSPSDYHHLTRQAESISYPPTQPIYSPEQQSQISWDDLYPDVLPPTEQIARPQSESDQQHLVRPEHNMPSTDSNVLSSDIEDFHNQQISELKKRVSALTEANNDLHEKLIERDDTIENHGAIYDKLKQEVKDEKTATANAQYGIVDLQKSLKEKAEQFTKEKEQHDALKQDKKLVEIQNEKLRKEMNKVKDMLKVQIDEHEKVQEAHDDLIYDAEVRKQDLVEREEEITNYEVQRQRDLVKIGRLDDIHNVLATHLHLENASDITTVTPAEISGLIQQLANSDRPGSPEYNTSSPTEPRGGRLGGRPTTTRHVSLSDQLGDERLSESEDEEDEEESKEEAPAVVADTTKPVGLGLAGEKLPELKEEVESDTSREPAANTADTAPAGQTAEEAAILAPTKPNNAAPTLPLSSKPELGSNLSRYADKKRSTDLLWYVWLFLGLNTLLLLFINWQERQLWHGANESARDAIVQHRELRSMIFGKRNGALWAQHLRFEIERLIGVDTGVLG